MTGGPAVDGRPRAGVIGLGMIGGGIAVSLARIGRPAAAVYDVRPDLSTTLDGVPAQSASPRDVATACDVVLVAVVDGDQARSVLDGADGVLAAARPGLVVVLLSTVGLDVVRELAARCAEREVVLLDAGVTGGPQAAENGLVTMVGGPEEAVARARPVLEDFSRAVVHCGPLGSGMVAKLARNAITYAIWAAVREATGLAAAAGVVPTTLLEVLEGAGDAVSPLLHLQLLAADYAIPDDQVDWAAALADKDLAAAQQLAGEVGLETAIVDLVRPRMRAVYAGELDEPPAADARERGLATMDRTYGPGFSALVGGSLDSPSVEQTVDQLFANVWARPHLTLRDRRLTTIGVTVMLGRADLLETQLRGALAAGELTDDQLRELALHLHYYAGWGNGTTLMGVTEKLVRERRARPQEA